MGKVADAVCEVVYRVFQNPRSTVTALGLVSALLAAEGLRHPKVGWIGDAGLCVTTLIKLFGTDQKQ